MAVGKRLRFQIFRRDNFACRYCGITAQAGAVLEVDHVTPRSAGGKDVPTNLVTACEDCNNGKSDIPLGAPVVEDVPQADFQAALAMRNSSSDHPYAKLIERAEELEVTAGLFWYVGLQRSADSELQRSVDYVTSGRASVSRALAIAAGYEEDDLADAAMAAGQDGTYDLVPYLPQRGTGSESPEGRADYLTAVDFMSKLVPAEQGALIWRVRLEAGECVPTAQQLLRSAAELGRRLVEDPGRDAEVLRGWLDGFPDGEGAKFLAEAAGQWDKHWDGRAGFSSRDSAQEVLELAVALALGEEVPA